VKFRGIRALIDSDAVRWIRTELNLSLKDLFHGINYLNFADNFDSFEYSGTINAGSEVRITNQLEKRKNLAPPIPSGYLVIRNSAGQAIGDGATAWDENNVYIQNYGGSSTDVTVIFFK
jgi:hypothetical protein